LEKALNPANGLDDTVISKPRGFLAINMLSLLDSRCNAIRLAEK
jgi:hypothetical protein